MEHDETELEQRLREVLERKADESPPTPDLSPATMRRARRRIGLTIGAGALAFALVGLGLFTAVSRFTGTEVTPGGGPMVIGPREAENPQIKFDGSLGDFGCTYNGPQTAPAGEEITFEMTNDGQVDFFVDVVRFTRGKTFDDLVAYVNDPREDPEVRPEWAQSQGVFLAVPGTSESWTRTLPSGEYAVACFITQPPRLWLLTPLTAEG